MTDRGADELSVRVLTNVRWPIAAVGVVLGSILLLGNFTALAEEPVAQTELQARLDRGHAIAVANCSACHAIGLTDKSPTRINTNTAFRQLSERYPIPMLEAAARTGNISGHDEMPGFQFSMDDITALLTYIDSMAPTDAHYIAAPD